LLVTVATELAVFRRGEPVLVIAEEVVFSFWPEFRDSQAKGLVIFRVGAGAGGIVVLGAGATGLVFGGESFEGDHGIEGRDDAILLRESFFVGCFSGSVAGCSSASAST
jgi:hypothetical protein